MFPMLTFELSGCEPNCDFAFRGTIQDGRMELRDALIEWSAVDPKTGETICGSPEELEEALGEDWSEDATYGVGPDMPEQADVRQAHAWLEQQELIESKLIDDEERWRLTDKGKLWYVEVGLLPYNEIRKKALLHQRGLAEILFFASQIPYLPAAEQETLSDEDKHPFARTGFLMDLRAGKRRLILNEGEYEFKNPAAERIDKIKEAAKAFAAKRSAA
jgi:hypothetical protein